MDSVRLLNPCVSKPLGIPTLRFQVSYRHHWSSTRSAPSVRRSLAKRFGLNKHPAAVASRTSPAALRAVGEFSHLVVEGELEIKEDADVFSTASCSVGPAAEAFERSASLSRSFVLIKPTTAILKRVLPRKSVSGRPAPFLVVLMTSVLYLWLSIRTVISNKVKACGQCAGYGITKCDLCEGHRVVWWEGKYKHVEPCPKCFGKRYVRCSKCGGMFGRSLFSHTCSHKITVSELKQIEKEAKIDDSWVGNPKWVI